jgi:tyrosinase
MSRVRYSLYEIQEKYDTLEDKTLLENLIRAFRGIQELGPDDPNSFFCIGGYHGEPFRGEGVTNPEWWGGYCNHGNVLFPTWHRAYLLRIEDALRSIPGCQDVTLPFWDELFDLDNPIPTVLTAPEFPLDGRTDNPLYSYKLQLALKESVEGTDDRYSKPAGYETVRYPLSGLVGTDEDKEATEAHNQGYADPAKRTTTLNANVSNWLLGKVKIDDDGHTPMPDTYSILGRFYFCLQAPSYTIFSNTTSQNQYIKDHKERPHYVVSLESPHNAIHLSVGGFYQEGEYNADPIIGANGDMGDNETAGFDPIFFFHHCFIDYVFWLWQTKNRLTAAGSLSVDKGYPGTISQDGLPDIPPDTPLDMDTPLYPFKKPDGSWYTSFDVTDIENQLDYAYGLGSLNPWGSAPRLDEPEKAPIVRFKRVHNVNRAQYAGSFVIRTYAQGPGGAKVEIGRDAILSRWNVGGCANCQDKLNVESLVPLDATMLAVLRGGGADEDVRYWAEIQTHHGTRLSAPVDGGELVGEAPIVDDL